MVGLSFLLSACGGGSSGSSGPRPLPIQPIAEIQGLWVEADACHCSTKDNILDKEKIEVHCYHYFSGIRAVSGYIKLTEGQQCENGYRVPPDVAPRVREVIGGISGTAGFIRDPLAGIKDITYAVGTVRNITGATENATIWEEDPTGRNNTTEKVSFIDYRYSDTVARLTKRSIICSAYAKLEDELYIGIDSVGTPQAGLNEDDPVCYAKRYKTLERYLKVP